MNLFGSFNKTYVLQHPEKFQVDNHKNDNKEEDEEEEEEDIKYNANDEWIVTVNTPRVNNPKEFKHELTPPQLASLYVMNQMETYKKFPTDTLKFTSVLYILRNELGSGKTPIMIALITLFPIPYATKEHSVYVEMQKMPTNIRGIKGTRGIVTRQFQSVLRPAVIFVARNLLSQWQTEIKKFNPKLKVFVITDIRDLKEFYDIIKSNSTDINKYNVILVKNKDITGEWHYTENEEPDTTLDDLKIKKIYNVFGSICRDLCFTRVIVDDFDTIGVPGIATTINALATWVVSCTRIPIGRKIWRNRDYIDIESLVHNSNVMYYDIIDNDLLYNTFSVIVDPTFSKAYNLIGKLQMYYYLFKNAKAQVAELINLMAGDKVSAIMEALNGDAHEEAARLAGIESTDVNQILKSLLTNNYDRVKEASRILALFDNYFSKIDFDDLLPMDRNPDPEDRYYTRKDLRTGREIHYKYPGLKQILEEEEKKWREEYDVCSKSLNRFRDNVKENKCMVCCLPLDDPEESCCILPCCYNMIHSECAAMGCYFSKQYIGDKYTIVGRCPFDKTHIVHYTQLTHIGKGFDIGKLTEPKFEEVKVASVDIKTPMDEDEEVDRDKYSALVDIIRGKVPAERKEIDLHIPALMTGIKSLGDPKYKSSYILQKINTKKYSSKLKSTIMSLLEPDEIPRVLVFANFEDTLDKTQDRLRKEHIPFERLGGHQTQLNQVIDNFQTGKNNVLLINGTQHCAGLNLQMATDLVFMHQVRDEGLQSQIAGRFQRIGRTCDSGMHWLLYNNELEYLRETYRRR